MAQINFDDIDRTSSSSSNFNNSVSFFSIGDGEEAIVRFMLDSPEDFSKYMYEVHNVTVDGKYREVNCIRTALDPIEACPLCANGTQIKRCLYVPMLMYVRNSDGSVNAEAKIWTGRSMTMAKQLRSYLNDYGPLSDIICKVKRTGKGLDTRWEISPNLNQSVYRPDIYVKNTEAFNNYSVLGSLILNKTAEEINTFIATGSFPVTNTNNKEQTSADNSQPINYGEGFTRDGVPVWSPQTTPFQAPPTVAPTWEGPNDVPRQATPGGYYQTTTTGSQPMPWQNNSQTISSGAPARPVRTY